MGMVRYGCRILCLNLVAGFAFNWVQISVWFGGRGCHRLGFPFSLMMLRFDQTMDLWLGFVCIRQYCRGLLDSFHWLDFFLHFYAWFRLFRRILFLGRKRFIHLPFNFGLRLTARF